MLDKVHKTVQISAVIFGVIIPCVMFSGFVYYLGYIITFGLDPSLVPRSLGDFFIESWYLGTLVFVYVLKFWWWPIFLFGAMSWLLFFAMYLKSKEWLKVGDPISKENPGRKILGLAQWDWIRWWRTVEEMYVWLAISLVFLLLPYLVLVSPFGKGKNDALKQMEQLSNHQCNPFEVKKDEVACISIIDISVTPNKVLLQGVSVATNGNRIAIYNGKVLEVWPITNSMKIQKNVSGSIVPVSSTQN